MRTHFGTIIAIEESITKNNMNKNEIIAELKKEFAPRSGFGATGFRLDSITAFLNERMPNDKVRINVPYNNFNVRGKVADVHHDVHGVMPYTYLCVYYDEVVEEEDTTTLYYGDTRCGRGNYIPFLSDCDVYYVANCKEEGDELTIDVTKGQSWREYL
jgi:hypothetical protein